MLSATLGNFQGFEKRNCASWSNCPPFSPKHPERCNTKINQTKRMTYSPSYSITGKRIMKQDDSAHFFVSIAEDSTFCDVIGQLYDFVADTNADADTAYDWVCEMCDIQTFVADTYAWDMFYNVWEQAAGE